MAPPQKSLRAGPAKMPLGNWYPAGTNHFNQADFCLAEMKKPHMSSNKIMVLCGDF